MVQDFPVISQRGLSADFPGISPGFPWETEILRVFLREIS
ncbi:hypothetical protein CGLO_18349 [Colletotrichum gloeosporioides Cg-14]|uniref:Uncharacterized protein n=1 Tax=Colletotrichum gloeosporioides (strain Cg-14) TaxID=1237896 RepID=T0JRU2_COLGC|nr:hypothetical protein CGLO_18349 [Colletotrichum gloeosporioides Cg-14]